MTVDSPSPATCREDDKPRLLLIGVLAVLVLGAAIPLAINIVDPDLWGHVRYGQDWIAEGVLPRTTTHSFTAEGYPWINHENLAELAFAWGFDHLGVYPMLVVKCLWGLLILSTMAWVARRHDVHLVLAWALFLLVAQAMQAFFPMRPQILSFAWFAAMMVCVDRAFCQLAERGAVNLRWLAPLPVVAVVAVNSHGGFALSIGVTGVVLMGRMIQLFIRRGWNSWKVQLAIAATGLACLGATLVNPYGFKLLSWLYWDMALPRTEISEWLPPKLGNPVFAPFVALQAVAAGALVGSRKRRDWVHITILALTCWQSWMHLRHIAFFALMCGFWLPEHLQSALSRLRHAKPVDADSPPIERHPAPRWLQAALAVVVIGAITAESVSLGARLSDLPVYRNLYPVDIVQFMVDHRIKGKLVCNFNWAQYVLAALAPDVTVSYDGRCRTCYSQELHDMTFDFLVGRHDVPRGRLATSGPIDTMRALQYKDPDLALIDQHYTGCVEQMNDLCSGDSPEWTLLYSNQMGALYGRTSKFGDPASPNYIPPDERLIDQKLYMAKFQWPAFPDRSLAEDLEAADRGVVARPPRRLLPPLGAAN